MVYVGGGGNGHGDLALKTHDMTVANIRLAHRDYSINIIVGKRRRARSKPPHAEEAGEEEARLRLPLANCEEAAAEVAANQCCTFDGVVGPFNPYSRDWEDRKGEWDGTIRGGTGCYNPRRSETG